MSNSRWYVRPNQVRPKNLRALLRHGGQGLGSLHRGRKIGDYRYVVILTFGRSGSTALQKAMNAIPGVVVRGENMGIAAQLAKVHAAATAQASENHGKGIMVSDPGDPWFGAQLIDPDSVLEALQAMMLNEILKPPRTARVVGFKEVRHTGAEFASYEEFRAYAMFLNKLLPGVNVILNVRSVRDAATSAWWADMEDATEILSECIRWLTMLDAEAASMGLRCHLVSHDEWSLDPGVLLDTFRACGLDPDPAVITAALSTELTHLKVAPEGDPATAT